MNISNISAYISELISADRIGAKISLGILAYILLSVILGILFGLKRGFGKSVVRILTVAISAVISVFVSSMIIGWLLSFVEGKTLEEVVMMCVKDYEDSVPENYRNIIASFDTGTAAAILEFVIALVVIPLVFIVIFALLNTILMIVYAIISAILGLTGYRKGLFSTLGGMVVGAVQGALIAAVVLIPVAGFAGLASEVRVTLTSENVSEQTGQKVDEFYSSWLDDSINNPALELINRFGGDFVFTKLTTAPVGEDKVDMGEEAKTFVNIAVDAIRLKETDWKAPDKEKQDIMHLIAEDIGNDKYAAGIVAGLLRGASTAIDNGSFSLSDSEDDMFSAVIKEVTQIFLTSDKNNLKGDLDTILNVYFIVGDHGIIVAIMDGDSDALLDALTNENDGGTAVSQVIEALESNPRTKHLVSTITKLSVSMMADSMGLDEEATQLYTDVKSGIKEVLEINSLDYSTEEEYKAAVGTKVNETLSDKGINLEPEVVDGIADYIAENYSNTSDISDEDVDKALLSYYDAYISYINGSSAEQPEGAPDVPSLTE